MATISALSPQSPERGRFLFPPLMSALDTYTDTSYEMTAGIVMDSLRIKKAKKKVKKGKVNKLVGKMSSSLPKTGGRLSPLKGSPKSPMGIPEEDDDKDNFSLQEMQSPSFPSPPPAGVARSGSFAARTPRTGRYYKENSDQAAVSPIPPRSADQVPGRPNSAFASPEVSFNKAINSIAALKLHSYATKRRQQQAKKAQMWKDLKSIQVLTHQEVRPAPKHQVYEAVAAWKLRYFIEYIRLKVMRREKAQAARVANDKDGEITALKALLSGTKAEIQDIVFSHKQHQELLEQSNQSSQLIQFDKQAVQAELAVMTDKASKLEQMVAGHEQRAVQHAQQLADAEMKTEIVKKELEITRLTCQELIKANLSKDSNLQEFDQRIGHQIAEQNVFSRQYTDLQQTYRQLLEHYQFYQEDMERYVVDRQWKGKVEQREQALEELRHERDDLVDQLYSQQQTSDQLRSQVTGFEEESKKLRAEHSAMAKLTVDLALQLETSRNDHLQAVEVIRVKDSELHTLKADHEADHKALHATLDSLTEQLQRAQATEALALLARENADMSAEDEFAQHNNTASAFVQLEDDHVHLKNAFLDLHKRVYSPKKKGSTANFESTMSESVRYAMESIVPARRSSMDWTRANTPKEPSTSALEEKLLSLVQRLEDKVQFMETLSSPTVDRFLRDDFSAFRPGSTSAGVDQGVGSNRVSSEPFPAQAMGVERSTSTSQPSMEVKAATAPAASAAVSHSTPAKTSKRKSVEQAAVAQPTAVPTPVAPVQPNPVVPASDAISAAVPTVATQSPPPVVSAAKVAPTPVNTMVEQPSAPRQDTVPVERFVTSAPSSTSAPASTEAMRFAQAPSSAPADPPGQLIAATSIITAGFASDLSAPSTADRGATVWSADSALPLSASSSALARQPVVLSAEEEAQKQHFIQEHLHLENIFHDLQLQVNLLKDEMQQETDNVAILMQELDQYTSTMDNYFKEFAAVYGRLPSEHELDENAHAYLQEIDAIKQDIDIRQQNNQIREDNINILKQDLSRLNVDLESNAEVFMQHYNEHIVQHYPEGLAATLETLTTKQKTVMNQSDAGGRDRLQSEAESVTSIASDGKPKSKTKKKSPKRAKRNDSDDDSTASGNEESVESLKKPKKKEKAKKGKKKKKAASFAVNDESDVGSESDIAMHFPVRASSAPTSGSNDLSAEEKPYSPPAQEYEDTLHTIQEGNRGGTAYSDFDGQLDSQHQSLEASPAMKTMFDLFNHDSPAAAIAPEESQQMEQEAEKVVEPRHDMVNIRRHSQVAIADVLAAAMHSAQAKSAVKSHPEPAHHKVIAAPHLHGHPEEKAPSTGLRDTTTAQSPDPSAAVHEDTIADTIVTPKGSRGHTPSGGGSRTSTPNVAAEDGVSDLNPRPRTHSRQGSRHGARPSAGLFDIQQNFPAERRQRSAGSMKADQEVNKPQSAVAPSEASSSPGMTPLEGQARLTSADRASSRATSRGLKKRQTEADAMASPEELQAEYALLKKDLKKWRQDFIDANGRAPSIDDFQTLENDVKMKIARRNQLKKLLGATGGDDA